MLDIRRTLLCRQLGPHRSGYLGDLCARKSLLLARLDCLCELVAYLRCVDLQSIRDEFRENLGPIRAIPRKRWEPWEGRLASRAGALVALWVCRGQ